MQYIADKHGHPIAAHLDEKLLSSYTGNLRLDAQIFKNAEDFLKSGYMIRFKLALLLINRRVDARVNEQAIRTVAENLCYLPVEYLQRAIEANVIVTMTYVSLSGSKLM